MSSVIQGLIAGLSSVGLLLLLLILVKNQIPEIVALRDWMQFSLVFLSMILAGIIISALSTRFAVKRYLQTSSNELH
jgi:cell division transport system permease protein